MKTILRACGLWLAAALTSMAQAATITYYHNDFAGSPVVATNQSGQVVWRESYRPYGERLTNSAASSGNDIWFASRRQDVDTGLVYMGARYYDPVAGRFISPDPMQFDGADPHTFNRYTYAANNPYKYKDPDGRRFEFAYGTTEAFKSDIAQMRRYLDNAGVGGILGDIEQRPEVVRLQQGAPGTMMFVPDSSTIIIDTRSGNRLGDGGTQSPALGFLHEASHALQSLAHKKQFDSDRRTFDATYDNKEERQGDRAR